MVRRTSKEGLPAISGFAKERAAFLGAQLEPKSAAVLPKPDTAPRHIKMARPARLEIHERAKATSPLPIQAYLAHPPLRPDSKSHSLCPPLR
jgi:hypothetical protein